MRGLNQQGQAWTNVVPNDEDIDRRTCIDEHDDVPLQTLQLHQQTPQVRMLPTNCVQHKQLLDGLRVTQLAQ